MDHFSKLVGLALLSAAGSASAYVYPAPPPGFSGAPGNWTFAPPSGQQQIGGIMRQSQALRLGGNATVGAAYRLGPNAARVAAAAIFMNPYVRVGVGIASWLGVAGIVWDALNNQWAQQDKSAVLSDGKTYSIQGITGPSMEGVCKTYVQNLTDWQYSHVGTEGQYSYCYYINKYNPSNVAQTSFYIGTSQCPVGWYVTPAGCVQNPPLITVTKPEFEDLLEPTPMPQTVPGELPQPTPLPIVEPVPNPSPADPPSPQPTFVPTGDPVPNPTYDPNAAPSLTNQPYIQPGTRYDPSPAPSEPWRYDVKPVNRPVSSPTPMPEPITETDPNAPAGDTPSQQPTDFCEKNPDVLACIKTDEPDTEEIPESQKQISITPDSGWGASDAACPAPKMLTVQGRSIPIPFDLFCTYMQGMRPIILAMAWLSAAFILLGARESN